MGVECFEKQKNKTKTVIKYDGRVYLEHTFIQVKTQNITKDRVNASIVNAHCVASCGKPMYEYFVSRDIQMYISFKLDLNFIKGVLHPWPILWLFMHFSQKLQHIGDK